MDNIKYTSFLSSVEIHDTFRKPINNKERQIRIQGKDSASLIPYYGATGQVGYIDDYLTDGEYVLLGEDGAPFLNPLAKKAYIIQGKAWVNNHAHILRSKTNNRFLCHYLNYFRYDGFVSGTTRLKLTQADLKRIPIPDLLIEEQTRIVEKIEALFSELDKGIDELKQAKARLKVYRQAVLKQAFEGVTSFETIENLSMMVTSGSRGWAKFYSDSGAKFIRIGNLTRDTIKIDLTDIQYVSLPDKAEGLRSRLREDDILISITADLGSIGLVTQGIGEAYINQHIAMVRLKNTACARYYSYYLKSQSGRDSLLQNKRGAGKLGLGLVDIRSTLVPQVSAENAEHIVTQIESRLSVCDKIEQTVDEQLQKAESLRQSILKQAFEGRWCKMSIEYQKLLKYVRDGKNVIYHHDNDDGTTIARVLSNMTSNERPDFYYKDGNRVYIVEHFEFDATQKTRKGMKGFAREREIERNFANMPVQSDGTTQALEPIGKVISKEWYIQNITHVFNDHYKKIPQYKQNLIAQGKASENADFVVGFFIENEYPPLYDICDELNLLHIKQFLDIFERSDQVDFVVFGGYFGTEKRLFSMNRTAIPLFREGEIDLESIQFSRLNHNEVQWSGEFIVDKPNV